MSLKQRAILVSLTVSKPKVSEKDKGATRETALLTTRPRPRSLSSRSCIPNTCLTRSLRRSLPRAGMSSP